MDKWLSLLAGGLLGTAARYLVYQGVARLVGPVTFPYGTLAINLSACMLIGFVSVFSDVRNLLGVDARLFLVTGFCGAFSTFSSYILEASEMIQDGRPLRGVLYLSVSVVAGLLFFVAGEMLAKRLS